MRIHYRLGFLVSLLALGGLMLACDETKTARPAPTNTTNWAQDHWNKVTPTQSQPGRVDPRYGRQGRRLGILQIQRLIPKLFNGIDWTEGENRSLFEKYSRTLGQADYVFQNLSHRTPTPLFMKFMDDMAGQVCKKAIAADRKNSDANTRMVLRYERSPDQNLRYLRLKLHTIYVPEDSSDGIRELRNLYDKALAINQKPDDAWFAVCVAMLSSPEFFAY